jgi:hypothetical protein
LLEEVRGYRADLRLREARIVEGLRTFEEELMAEFRRFSDEIAGLQEAVEGLGGFVRAERGRKRRRNVLSDDD